VSAAHTSDQIDTILNRFRDAIQPLKAQAANAD